jgi:GNAT superfamily N-acetyltransferase
MPNIPSGNLIVKPVESYREKLAFLNLPWELYKSDPYWTPPLRDHQWELLNYKPHPFYLRSKIQTYLALRDDKPVGRIAAILNTAHNDFQNEKRSFWGFFESINDPEVAAGLFSAARSWAKEQGYPVLRGPANPTLNYECGLLVEGFDSPATFGLTYNPPYYESLVEQAGFKKVQDLYAFWGYVDMMAALDEKMRFVVGEATSRFNVTLRTLNPKRFVEDVHIFLDIYNRSLGGTWGFSALSKEEADHIANSVKHLLVPELTTIAEINGEPVAACYAILDYNPRIKKIDGRLFPFGFIRLLTNRKSIKRVRLISANVLPEYQRWGLGLVVLARLIRPAINWGLTDAEFSWVLESNHLSCGSLKRGGAKLIKTYRMYDSQEAEEYDKANKGHPAK